MVAYAYLRCSPAIGVYPVVEHICLSLDFQSCFCGSCQRWDLGAPAPPLLWHKRNLKIILNQTFARIAPNFSDRVITVRFFPCLFLNPILKGPPTCPCPPVRLSTPLLFCGKINYCMFYFMNVSGRNDEWLVISRYYRRSPRQWITFWTLLPLAPKRTHRHTLSLSHTHNHTSHTYTCTTSHMRTSHRRH